MTLYRSRRTIWTTLPTLIFLLVSACELPLVYTPPPETTWAWGYNHQGQLGYATNNPNKTSAVPTEVTALGSSTLRTAGGNEHSLALKDRGTVWAWGGNGKGQLGTGSINPSATPVQIGGISNVIAIAAGMETSLALKSDGTVWAWGDNSSGQLGTLSPPFSSTPVQVAGLTQIKAISAGLNHHLAVKDDGTVWGWGANYNSQLGQVASPPITTPVQIGGISDVVRVDAGYHHSVALKANGTVWTWGSNGLYQLGTGKTPAQQSFSAVPTQVNVAPAKAIVTWSANTWVLASDGTVWAWGPNSIGDLGDGTMTPHASPVKVVGLNNVVDINTGGSHTVATKDDGSTWAWGSNTTGQLGIGILNSFGTTTPVKVQGLIGAIRIGTGYGFNLAVVGGFPTFSPTALNFGAVAAGTKSVEALITITNSGSETLNLGGTSITGMQAADFEVRMPGAGARLISPGGTTTIGVTFVPKATGPRQAELQISTNSVASPSKVPLQGIGS